MRHCFDDLRDFLFELKTSFRLTFLITCQNAPAYTKMLAHTNATVI
jgi:hypothetical protein